MTSQEMAGWLAERRRDYIASRVASGEPVPIAEANAAASYARLFPDGTPAEGHDVFVLVETMNTDDAEAVAVGFLWIGPYPDDRANAMWVWSVAVDEHHRGRGLGRAAMLLAEDEARRRGATELGLNVFGFNDVAIGLYRSLGYETSSVQMRKLL
jgi:ribosomal protein S18 acetylase RimI-like enzyme